MGVSEEKCRGREEQAELITPAVPNLPGFRHTRERYHLTGPQLPLSLDHSYHLTGPQLPVSLSLDHSYHSLSLSGQQLPSHWTAATISLDRSYHLTGPQLPLSLIYLHSSLAEVFTG